MEINERRKYCAGKIKRMLDVNDYFILFFLFIYFIHVPPNGMERRTPNGTHSKIEFREIKMKMKALNAIERLY